MGALMFQIHMKPEVVLLLVWVYIRLFRIFVKDQFLILTQSLTNLF